MRGDSFFVPSAIENERPGHSYSIETIRQFRQHYNEDTDFYFIVGMDSFLEISTWKKYHELFKESAFVALNRPGFHSGRLETFIREKVSSEYVFHGKENIFTHPELKPIYYRQTTLLDISSSRIRNIIANRRSTRFLLPEGVEQYIQEKGLYLE